jgi:hypothetical protein
MTAEIKLYIKYPLKLHENMLLSNPVVKFLLVCPVLTL